jgi:hypothetical protein
MECRPRKITRASELGRGRADSDSVNASAECGSRVEREHAAEVMEGKHTRLMVVLLHEEVV